MSGLKGFRAISTLIQKNLQHYDNRPVAAEIQTALTRKWLQCAGRAAPFSYPLLFQSGRLVIFTQSAVWSTELRHQIQHIQKQLTDFQFDTVEIKVMPSRVAPSPPAKIKRTISNRNKAALKALSRQLKHPGLKAALSRLGQIKRQS